MTYAEIRQWARWLDMFTATDIAGVLAVHQELGERAIRALLWHGIIEETGDLLDGPYGLEPVYSYKPLPKGPRVHPHETPPEVLVARQAGGDPLRVPRGMPVPGTSRRSRVNGSTTGTRRPGRTHGGVAMRLGRREGKS
jgi:hypothetical protein